MNGSHQTDPFLINCGRQTLDCRAEARTLIMGILNATPDSFADGGKYVTLDKAVRRIDEMVGEGVDILDIGGESTRPRGQIYGSGATPVDIENEIIRVIPIIKETRKRHPDLIISVDTYKADVAKASLDAGADMINDVTGLRLDRSMAQIVARARVPLIVMHSVGTPGSMPQKAEYDDVVTHVSASLKVSLDIALEAGVTQLIVDPGFGFGKSVSDNLSLIANLNELSTLGRPILVGISRKSTIGTILSYNDQPVAVADRLYGSLGASAVAIMNGAAIVRCHDVAATRDLARTVDALSRLSRQESEVTA